MHPVHERLTEPGGLAERLLGLRKAAGLTGDDLAAQLSWPRSKVSKIENGRQVPSPDDIRAWAVACGHPEAADDLLELLADVQSVHTRWRNRVRRGGQASIQADIDLMTQTALRIRNAEVAIIPGLLQTAGYARAIAIQSAMIHGNTDIDAAVAARMRRQEILYDSAKRFEFVMTETALRMLSCPRNVMFGQLDRLLSMDMENVTLGIIPMGRELQMTLYNGFLMLDDVLITESYGYEDQGTDQAETHARIFEMLMDESATGEDARRLVVAAAASLRQELETGKSHVRPASAELHHPAELPSARSHRWQPQAGRLADDRRLHHRRLRPGSGARILVAALCVQNQFQRSDDPDAPHARHGAVRTVEDG